MGILVRSMAALLGGAFVLVVSGAARAELQRVEAVGIYGIRDSMRSRVIPRDEAVARARWEGVSRVAIELIGESAPRDEEGAVEVPTEGFAPTDTEGPSEDKVALLRTALGDDVLPYMRSYRILEDRGEVPVLFNDAPEVAVEYVVVVEVIVDVDRVTNALASAGLIDAARPAATTEAVVVELIGLSRYEALELVLEALREQTGATRIRTVEFSRERQVLSVEGPLGPDALLAKLARFKDPRLILKPIGVDAAGRRIRLTGRWFPESAADSAPSS